MKTALAMGEPEEPEPGVEQPMGIYGPTVWWNGPAGWIYPPTTGTYMPASTWTRTYVWGDTL